MNDDKSRDQRRRKVYKLYLRLAFPDYDTMRDKLEHEQNDIPVDDIDLLPWTKDKTAVDDEAYKRLTGSRSKLPSRDRELPTERGLSGMRAQRRKSFGKNGNAGGGTNVGKLGTITAENQNMPLQRAHTWYVRMARPSRTAMYRQVQSTPGCDITKKDVDLLPWNRSGEWVDFRKMERMLKEERDAAAGGAPSEIGPSESNDDGSDENSDFDKEIEDLKEAYRWYNKLGKPTREVMKNTRKETTGMLVSKHQLDDLPWDKERQKVDLKRLKRKYSGKDADQAHAALVAIENEVKLVMKRHEANDAAPPAIGSAEDTMNAYEWYKKLGQPTQKQFLRIVDETEGVTCNKDDIKRLPWNDDKTVVLDGEVGKLAGKLAGRNKEEEKQFQREVDAMKNAYKWYNKLAKPNKDVLKAARKQTQDMALTKDEIDSLPWNKEREKVDLKRLKKKYNGDQAKRAEEALRAIQDEIEENQKKYEAEDTVQPELESTDEEMDGKLDAYGWYKKLEKPTQQQFLRMIDETKGITCTKDDVKRLPWNANKTVVLYEHMEQFKRDVEDAKLKNSLKRHAKEKEAEEEKRHREEEEEKLRQAEEAHRKAADELARLRAEKQEEARRKEEEEKRKVDVEEALRREAERRKQKDAEEAARKKEEEEIQQKIIEAQELRRKKNEEKAAKAAAEEERRWKEAEETTPAPGTTPTSDGGGENRAEIERLIREALPKGWEDKAYTPEGRALRAYAWYGRLARPNKKNFKRRVANLKVCDIEPDDIDILPWDAFGNMVNVAKINILIREGKLV